MIYIKNNEIKKHLDNKHKILWKIYKNINLYIILRNIIKNFIGEMDYNLYLSIENNCCICKFQKGQKYGEYCNRKIYIKTESINFYCSRHNRNYDVVPRNYNNINGVNM